MSKRIPIKNYLYEVRLINHRTLTALVLIVILILLLIFRLGYLQLAKHDLYKTLSKKNWLDLVPLEPTRGLVYDRHGVLLAENIPIFSLDVIPNKVSNIPHLLAALANIIKLDDTDIAQFQKELKQHRRFDEIPLKLRLTEDEVARFYENQYRFPGVLVRARLMRHYPQGDLFSHVLGYVARINIDELKNIDPANYSVTNYIGKLGIEKYYEDDLHGTVGYEQAETDAAGQTIRVVKQIKPIPGKNLFLTLDAGLQKVATEAIQGFRGAIVAIQPSTGQVLAMVSAPNFDPNSFVTGISTADYQTLQKSPDRPLYDRAIRGLYPPASTIKPYMAIEGLDSGIISPEDTIFDPGWFQLENSNRIFHDWKRTGHGEVNLNRALTNSCDTYFFNLANRMGINRIDRIMSLFGFGDETGIDLPDELTGTVPSPDWKKRMRGASWYPGDTLNTGVGQGLAQVTPLQMANAVSIIANRGQHYSPYLILGEQEPNQSYVATKPIALEPVQLQDASTWLTIIKAMQSVVESPYGTAHLLEPLTFTVAAKTGTAQVYSLKQTDEKIDQTHIAANLRDHSLLIVFAPIEKPQIAIAIVVENSVKSLNAENHGPAIGIARKLLNYYFLPPQASIPNGANGVS